MSTLLADLTPSPTALLLGMLLSVLVLGLRPHLAKHRRLRAARLPPWTPPWLHPHAPRPRAQQSSRRATRRQRPAGTGARSVAIRRSAVAVWARTMQAWAWFRMIVTDQARCSMTASQGLRLWRNRSQRPRRAPAIRAASSHSSVSSVAPRRTAAGPTYELVFAGCGLIEAAAHAAGLNEAVRTITDTGRAMTIDLALSASLNATQRRLLLTAARTFAPKARWISDRLYLPGPFASPDSFPQSPCVPILRQRRMTIWWSLGYVQHIILAGDALPTLLGMLPALRAMQERQAASIALYDPAGILGTQAVTFPAASDALSLACTRALRDAWGGQSPGLAPVVLLAIAPDTLAWAELAPLLVERAGSVHAIVLLGTDADHQMARAACHKVGVIEIGGPAAVPLSESFRPPGLAAPRERSALAWHTHRSVWRGAPLDPAGGVLPHSQEVGL